MPPSRHSSSSHSSRSSSSRSSSRSTSSHSSSSHSSSGSSRSYSSRGPSSHSWTSHSSRAGYSGAASSYRSQSRSSTKPAPQPVHRPRVNQPVGFLISQMLKPTYYYGRRHDYVYYPESWTDSESGTYYEKGYYDENGRYYDSVSFQKNGRYDNVLCQCPYCGTEKLMGLDNRSGSSQSLECPGCGATMEIKSELDEILEEKVERQRQKKLDAYQDRLASLTFLDPACGSGNFLTETFFFCQKRIPSSAKPAGDRTLPAGYTTR